MNNEKMAQEHILMEASDDYINQQSTTLVPLKLHPIHNCLSRLTLGHNLVHL